MTDVAEIMKVTRCPAGWRRGKIDLSGFDGKPYRFGWPAFVKGIFAIHLTDINRPRDDAWTLTHIPTGFAARQFLASPKLAILLARRIRPIAAWTTLRKESDVPKKKQMAIRAILDEFPRNL